MTNPINKYSKEEFLHKVNDTNTNIKVFINEYKGVDAKYKYKCKHGTYELFGWQLISRKYCCQTGYHENRIPAQKKTINDRVQEIKKRWYDHYILSNARFDPTERRKIIVECKVHGEFSQWTRSLVGNSVVNEACPTCSKENNRERSRIAAHINFKPY